MRKCSIHLCGCTSTSHPDLCFYRLPIQEYRSEQWLKLITLDRPYSSQRSILVCGLHFPGGGKTAKYDQPTILPCSEEWPTVIAHYRNKRASLLTSAASWGQPETHDPTPCSSQSVDGLPSQPQGTETWQGECVDKESGSPLPTPFKRRSEDSRLYFKNQHTDHWLEFHHKTPVLSCMGTYNEIQKVETASNSPSNASSSSTKTSDTALNAATSSVEEDDEDSDYEDPAVLLAEGKTKQLMKLLQGYRKANSISSTSENQSSSKEKKFAHVSKDESVTLHVSEEDTWSPLHSQVDDEVLESLVMPSSVNDKTQITDQHPTYKKTKTRLLTQDPVTVNIEGVTFMSVFNSSQENLLSKYIKTQRPKNKKGKRKGLIREEICKLVFDFCVSRNIRRPPLWDYKQEADMEWLKGFLRRYPCHEQNPFSSDDADNGENNFEGFEVEPDKTLAPVLMLSTESDEKALQRLGIRCDHDYAVKPKQYGDLFLNDNFSFS